MSSNFVTHVLPKIKSLQSKAAASEDISGSEIQELKDAIANMKTLPTKEEMNAAKAECAICLGCGFFHPGALAVSTVAAG